MDLTNDFDVPASIDETWATLTDLELIAPCMPGARLTEVEGDVHRGTVKVKVGPITAQFKGEASFLEADAAAHRAVLKAQGRDTTGKGNASATITAQLSEVDAGTHVALVTDLAISGRVAQFGRGALADVSSKLIGQFVHCLETSVLGPGVDEIATAGADAATDPAPAPSSDAAPSAGAASDAAGATGLPHGPDTPGATGAPATVRRIDAPEADAIDLLDTAGATTLKRLVPLGLAVLVVLWLLRRRR